MLSSFSSLRPASDAQSMISAFKLGVLASLIISIIARAQNSTGSAKDFDDLSLEQLINIQVTSVEKRETPLEKSPAAISVVTGDDIRRLGLTTIPDALRLVPGMDVAQINSHEWAVSARGFNDEFANKLLVLVDGRAVYTPTFGGVFWDVQNVMLEDLDRIEVIRGPGATLWGANAVNGVVNIITKSAKDTQGLLITTDGGTVDQPATSIRYGGQLATNLYYRTYVSYFNRDSFVQPNGQNAPDAWNQIRTGTRFDWEPSPDNRLTLQGDYYRSILHEKEDVITFTPPYSQTVGSIDNDDGWNVLGRWTHDISETSQFSIQTYYDHGKEELDKFSEIHNTLDFDAQHRFALGGRNDIMWGLEYRYSGLDLPQDFGLSFSPATRHDQLFSSFLQDDFTLVPDRLHLTAGTKLEHNDYTGFEVEPSGRLAWTPTEKQTAWVAVSRSVRTPSIFNLDATFNGPISPAPPSPLPIYLRLLPNPKLNSEELLAYEIGYRIQPARKLSFDLSGFYNIYHNLITYEDGAPFVEMSPQPHVVVPENTINGGHGDTYGVEISAQWQPLENWRLAASYSWFEQSSLSPQDAFLETAPEQQAQLRSYFNLTRSLELNNFVSYQGVLDTARGTSGTETIPAYVRLDAGLVWHATKSLEIGFWGQNLLRDKHKEFGSDTTILQTEVPRTFMGKITWRF